MDYVTNMLYGTNAYVSICDELWSANDVYRIGSSWWNGGIPEIKDVKFNGPATIVFWGDGTKTVVKCGDGDIFDPEKGLAMAISKKALGNKGHYFETIKKWTEGYSEENLWSNTFVDWLKESVHFQIPISDRDGEPEFFRDPWDD